MAGKKPSRRLTTIVAADVAGYSRLTAGDEEETLAALRSHRTEFIDPKIAEYRGRIVNTAGDSVLIEFPSVVEALCCSIDVQRGMAERNAKIPEDRRISFRIGINLGDIVEQDGDLLGEGVNVAARLEGLAVPGGICLSRAARDQVRDRLDIALEDMGEVKVKNIARPVRVFRVLGEGEAPTAPTRRLSKKNPFAAAVVGLLITVVGGGIWWWEPWVERIEPASVEQMVYPLPDRPSIAVLPFSNDSDDPKINDFVRGLTAGITTALSRAQGLFVIARNSAASYRDKPFKIKQLAEELGIRYVLQGGVQKQGENLRITTQLVDALNGRHVWAERFDRPASDVFALQDEITLRVIGELRVKLTEGDRARVAARSTKNFKVWLLAVEAYGEYLKFTREGMIRARELWQAAEAEDPNFAVPVASIGLTHWAEARWGWSKSREESILLATEYAERAIEMAPAEPLGYMLSVLFSFCAISPNRPSS